MMALTHKAGLMDRLPAVRGKLTANAQLARFAWFRVGGPAEVLFEPKDVEDLSAFMTGKPADVPVCVIGAASNLLIRDGGVPGVVIRLGRAFAGIAIDGDTVTAGAAAMDVNVARAARDAGLAGFEFLIGVPGAVGGACFMNAGAYGAEIRDIFVAAQAVSGRGEGLDLSPADMGFSYRRTELTPGAIVTEAAFKGRPDDITAISRRMADIQKSRSETQPVKSRTGGSTFSNPEGRSAWSLIDDAGCRGLTRGGAQVSPQHCNFLINTGTATAADLEGLGEEVRRRVMDKLGVRLHWEIRRIGEPPPGRMREVTS